MNNICWGYIRLDRLGDLETARPDEEESASGAASECIECGQPFYTASIWVAVMADGTLFGPLCDLCASSQ